MKKRFLVAVLAATMVLSTSVSAGLTAFAEAGTETGEEQTQTRATLFPDYVYLGDSIIVTAAPEAEEGTVYGIYYRREGNEKWATAKAYSEGTQAVIKPKYMGIYEVCVKAKNAAGIITKEYLSFETVGSELGLSWSQSADRVPLGTPLTVTGYVEDYNRGYSFVVCWKKKTDTNWLVALKDSDILDVDINPVKAGEYDLCVKVITETGRVIKNYSSFEMVDFQLETALQYPAFTLGKKQTVTAVVPEEITGCEYGFWYRKVGNSRWIMVQDYGEKNTCRFQPKEDGDYECCVKAKNANGAIRKQFPTFTVNEALSVTQNLSDETTTLGQSITVTSEASGGTGAIQKAVYYTTKEAYEAGTVKWNTALAFGQEGDAVITPDTTGEYVVVTKVKDETGAMAKSGYMTFTIEDNYDPLEVTGRFLESNAYAYRDRAITYTAQANGGDGNYTYAFHTRKQGTDSWKLLQDYSEESTVKFTSGPVMEISAKAGDTYEIRVTVKDSRGVTNEAISEFKLSPWEVYELPFIPNN